MLKNETEQNQLECCECGSTSIILDKLNGERVCSSCGCVLDQIILVSDYTSLSPPDTVLYVGDGNSSFINTGKTYLKRGLYSIIYSKQELHFKRYFLPTLRLICDKLLTPEHIRIHAVALYSKAIETGVFGRGIQRKPFIAASLYLAYRINRSPITLEDIVVRSDDDLRPVQKAYLKLRMKLDDEVPPITPEFFVPLVISKIKIPSPKRNNMLSKTMDLLEEVRKKDPAYVCGKNPQVLAGLFAYVVGKKLGLKITQSDVAMAADTHNGTISRSLKKFKSSNGLKLTLKNFNC